jgi:hypothetical protein
VFQRFGLSTDSLAAEIVSYAVKALIDPQGDWASSGTAADAAIDALIRLNRRVSDSRV